MGEVGEVDSRDGREPPLSGIKPLMSCDDMSEGKYQEQMGLCEEAARESERLSHVWVTREGKAIRYVDLADDHLDNIIAILRRKGMGKRVTTAAFYFFDEGPNGDQARVAFEEEGWEATKDVDLRLIAIVPLWQALLREKKLRRKKERRR